MICEQDQPKTLRKVASLRLSSHPVTSFSSSQPLQTRTMLKLTVFMCITFWLSLSQSGGWVREISFPPLKPSRGFGELMVELNRYTAQCSQAQHRPGWGKLIFPTYCVTIWCMMQCNIRVRAIQRKCWKRKAENQLSFEITLVSLHLNRNRMTNESLPNKAFIYPFFSRKFKDAGLIWIN